MRSNPIDYELVAPGTLEGVLSLMKEEPGGWLPIAGGTDVMVQYAAGSLAGRKLVSIWNLPELRRVEVFPDEIRIGAGCTYTDLRQHEVICREFPLVVSAARWTGGIANQNRGTLGGNIVNASPAADSLPALLAYEADLALCSARGERRVPYVQFHTGYKKMQMASDELIRSICVPRRFSGYLGYARKIGARNAQAISKVCIAALGTISEGVVTDIRIALGSVAPVPLRLARTEDLVRGKAIQPSLLEQARKTAAAEIRPIDDIRSSAAYRSTVAANLVVEFLERLAAGGEAGILMRWNSLPEEQAAREILRCCGSAAWAGRMAAGRPFPNDQALLEASDEAWGRLTQADWLEAFRGHPRIGESKASAAGEQSSAWSADEQHRVTRADDAVKLALAEGNREYERKFGRIFIVCATGKEPAEILKILRRRLANDEQTELRQAAEQQRQITQIRLRKWLKG